MTSEILIACRYDGLTEINLQVNMSEAIEAFINQKLINGKQLCGDEVSHQSKHFLDALKILNSNKDLFIELLQNPNSLWQETHFYWTAKFQGMPRFLSCLKH